MTARTSYMDLLIYTVDVNILIKEMNVLYSGVLKSETTTENAFKVYACKRKNRIPDSVIILRSF